MGRVLAILQPKGGAGKSTLATGLAAAYHRSGMNIVVVDSDPQGTARDWAASGGEGADLPLVVGVDRAAGLRKAVRNISETCQLVIIDGSARVDGMDAAALQVADFVLLPVTPSNADIWGAAPLVDLIRARQDVTGGTPKAAYVVSRQVAGSNLATEIEAALDGLPVLASRTTQRVAYAEALSAGRAVVDSSDVKAANEMKELATEVIRHFHA